MSTANSFIQRIKVAVLSQLAFWLALPLVLAALVLLPKPVVEWILSALPIALTIGLCFVIYKAFVNRSAAVSSREEDNG